MTGSPASPGTRTAHGAFLRRTGHGSSPPHREPSYSASIIYIINHAATRSVFRSGHGDLVERARRLNRSNIMWRSPGRRGGRSARNRRPATDPAWRRGPCLAELTNGRSPWHTSGRPEIPRRPPSHGPMSFTPWAPNRPAPSDLPPSTGSPIVRCFMPSDGASLCRALSGAKLVIPGPAADTGNLRPPHVEEPSRLPWGSHGVERILGYLAEHAARWRP